MEAGRPDEVGQAHGQGAGPPVQLDEEEQIVMELKGVDDQEEILNDVEV